MEKDEKAIANGRLGYEELRDFVDAFPALLWRIDLVNNKIEYLNSYRIESLGPNAGLLLQNEELRRRVVMEEDIYLLDDFMRAVRNGETTATVFRIKSRDRRAQWIKVTGVADPKNPRYFLGYMLDVTRTAGIVLSIAETEAETEAMIELLDRPVLLVDPRTKAIMAHNAAARETFLYKADDFSRLHFSDLYHKSVQSHIHRIYEELIFQKEWGGRLFFQRKNRSVFQGDARMGLLFFKGKRVLRISVDNIAAEDETPKHLEGTSSPPAPSSPSHASKVRELLGKVEKAKDIVEVLEILLDNQPGEDPFDAVIYSDIHAKRNKVIVYTAGNPFDPLPQGETFAYEGTIAENIERFKLDHLIVEDTFASIKAIDWALFIPHGIRSYFAKPFYSRKVMRSVLILCSVKRHHFSHHRLEEYAIYDAPFLLGLKNRRSRRRGRR